MEGQIFANLLKGVIPRKSVLNRLELMGKKFRVGLSFTVMVNAYEKVYLFLYF